MVKNISPFVQALHNLMQTLVKGENLFTVCPQPANLNFPYASNHFLAVSHLTENRLTALPLLHDEDEK